MRQCFIDDAERLVKAGAAARLVPVVARAEVVFEKPARRRVARREKRAQAAFREKIDPAVKQRRDVDKRGDAAEQQLAIGELGGRRATLVIGRREGLTALVKPG